MYVLRSLLSHTCVITRTRTSFFALEVLRSPTVFEKNVFDDPPSFFPGVKPCCGDSQFLYSFSFPLLPITKLPPPPWWWTPPPCRTAGLSPPASACSRWWQERREEALQRSSFLLPLTLSFFYLFAAPSLTRPVKEESTLPLEIALRRSWHLKGTTFDSPRIPLQDRSFPAFPRKKIFWNCFSVVLSFTSLQPRAPSNEYSVLPSLAAKF